MPLVSAAVYVVPGASAALGLSVAFTVAESYVVVAGTCVPSGALSVNVVLLRLAGSRARLNVAVTLASRWTPVADAAGAVAVAVSGGCVVVKLHEETRPSVVPAGAFTEASGGAVVRA